MIRLKVSELRQMGRNTQGVKLINLGKKNDEIASVCKVDTEPEELEESDITGNYPDVNSEIPSPEEPENTEESDDNNK